MVKTIVIWRNSLKQASQAVNLFFHNITVWKTIRFSNQIGNNTSFKDYFNIRSKDINTVTDNMLNALYPVFWGSFISVTTLITISTVKFLKPAQVSKQGIIVSERDKRSIACHIFLDIITNSSSSKKWDLVSPTPK